jgi:hypothetical protein
MVSAYGKHWDEYSRSHRGSHVGWHPTGRYRLRRRGHAGQYLPVIRSRIGRGRQTTLTNLLVHMGRGGLRRGLTHLVRLWRSTASTYSNMDIIVYAYSVDEANTFSTLLPSSK